jgi:hypothetical protein
MHATNRSCRGTIPHHCRATADARRFKFARSVSHTHCLFRPACSPTLVQVLVGIAGQLGGIEPLFDTLFSFLYLKTDYFHVMKPGDKIGFPPGRAQQLLLASFSKFERLAAETARRAEASQAARKSVPAPAAPAKKPAAPAPAAVQKQPKAAAAAATAAAAAGGGDSSAAPKAAVDPPKVDLSADTPSSASSDAPPASGATESGVAAAAAAGAKSASHLAEQVGVPYNGGHCKNYYWEQTLGDVTIHTPVPAGTRARDVVCTIGRSHVMLKLKGSAEALIDADYPCDARNGQEVWERVKSSDCYWNLGEAHGTHCVSIYLEKERESWWKSAVHGGEEIDTTQVDSTKDVGDYDNETQGHIRKIMFDQHQKRLGKPTSDDMKNEEMLRKAWDAEGSPFKGTPFDPSKINLGGGAGGGGGPPPG